MQIYLVAVLFWLVCGSITVRLIRQRYNWGIVVSLVYGVAFGCLGLFMVLYRISEHQGIMRYDDAWRGRPEKGFKQTGETAGMLVLFLGLFAYFSYAIGPK